MGLILFRHNDCNVNRKISLSIYLVGEGTNKKSGIMRNKLYYHSAYALNGFILY